MPENTRKKLIEQIERLRNSKVITYVTSSRPGINSDIESADLRYFHEHLKKIQDQTKNIDLFLYSFGGEMETAWNLVNLIHEYTENFSVLIPFHAHSAATLIAVGAKEIVMGKMATLGPIDPTIKLKGGKLHGLEFSTEDIDSYYEFIQKKNIIKNMDEMNTKMIDSVSPVLLGKAQRNFAETRKDAKLLLERYYQDKQIIEKIVQSLTKDIHTHNHGISRIEAQKIGLNIIRPETQLENLMWDLYLEYESVMKLNIPYSDMPPRNKATREIPFTYIETTDSSSKKVGLQRFKKLAIPKSSMLTVVDGQPSVFLPNGATVPIITSGELLAYEQNIYEKHENIHWITTPNY